MFQVVQNAKWLRHDGQEKIYTDIQVYTCMHVCTCAHKHTHTTGGTCLVFCMLTVAM